MGLVLLGLLGFDPEMGFVGLQFEGLELVGIGDHEIVRFVDLDLDLDFDFVWSCCLGLETGVLVGNGWESSWWVQQ